jgi:hypothetical protein
MVARGASQWPVGSKRHTLYTWLDSRVFSVAIVFFTFEALFAADLLQVMLPKDFDIPVAVVTFAGFLLFMLEIVANFWVHRDYGARKGCDKLTVFLFIDLAGTLSLIPDFLILFGVSFSGSKSASLARAGRAARIGARMARLVRMFRLDEEEVLYGPDGRKLEVKSSTIGATVADKISTRVVLLVMALIIVLPVITYADPPTMEETAIDLFAALAADSAPSKPTAQTMAEFIEWYNTCSFDRCDRLEEIVYMRDMIGGATVNLQTNPLTGEFEKKAYDDYRDSEMRSFAYTICSDGSTMSETFEYSRDASDARAPECNSGTPTQRFAVTFQIKALLHEQVRGRRLAADCPRLGRGAVDSRVWMVSDGVCVRVRVRVRACEVCDVVVLHGGGCGDLCDRCGRIPGRRAEVRDRARGAYLSAHVQPFRHARVPRPKRRQCEVADRPGRRRRHRRCRRWRGRGRGRSQALG